MDFMNETQVEIKEEIAEAVQEEMPALVIYGTTQSSLGAYTDCLGREGNILGFCDLDIAKQGEILEELPVYPVCRLKELDVKRVVLPSEHDNEITRELLAEQGVEEIIPFMLEVELKPYVIYGVGDWGNYAYTDLGAEIDIRFFVDRDKSRQGRDFHGKEVRDPEVLRQHTNIPVIIAVERNSGIKEYLQRMGVKKILYFRRGMSRDEFFRQVKGSKSQNREAVVANYYYEKGTPKVHRPSVEEVLAKLQPYDVISFDIFDTLLLRKVAFPNDVFEKMAIEMSHSDFCRVRKQAEDMARDAKEKETGSREVNLHDIYAVLESYYGIEPGWEDREIELELSLCEANPFMAELYKKLQEAGKTIVLMSDMYLPAKVIGRMLNKSGYSGWEKFYLSNELLMRKGEGTLQQELRKDYAGCAIAHIGDNLQGDVKKTIEAGIAALHWPDVRLDYRPNNLESMGGSLYLATINNHLGTGLWDKDLFYTHGYRVGGILTAGFCQYVDRVAKEKHIDKILFCARDCDIVSKAYKKYWGTVPSEYIEISRYAIFQATVERFLYDFLNRTVLRHAETFRSSLTIREIFQESGFGYLLPALEESDIEQFMFPNSLFDRRKQLRDFLFGQKEAIIAHCKPHAEVAKAYFSEIIGEAKNILIVDIGWTGTCISALKYFLESRFPEQELNVHGALLATSRDRNLVNGFENGTISSFAYSPFENLDQTRFMMPGGKSTKENDLLHMPLEFLFTSESASLLSYVKDEKGEISFIRTAHSPSSSEEIRLMQQGMLDFIGDYLAYAETLGGKLPLINPYVAFNPLTEAIRNKDYIYEVYKNFNYDAFSLPLREDLRPFGDLFDMARNFSAEVEEGKKRILFVTPELPYTGAPRSLLRMCKVARDLGYQPVVWSAKAGPFAREYEKENISLQIVPERELGSKAVKEQMETFAMAVCNTIVTDDYVRALEGKVPLVWYIREATNIPDFCRNKPRRLETLKESRDLCCVSQYAARAIEKYAEYPVRVIHNCVEDEVYMATDYVPGTGEKVRFVQFGTMEYRKGYDVLLSAYLTMPEEYREKAELYFAGGFINSGTSFCSYLFRRMKNVPGVHYLGVVRGEEKKIETLSSMDVVVVASRDESCSLVALEGAMLSKPLIVTENVGAKYMVTEENGSIVETGDVGNLRRAMMDMIDRKDELSAMGKASRRIYEEKASMDSYREDLRDLYGMYTGFYSKLKSGVIVSLTSYPGRLPTLHKCVKSLLEQSLRPEKVLLYLSLDQFPGQEEDLTPELLALREDEAFEIRFVEGDMGPHKKYWYAMQEYPDYPVIVVDDDAVYDYAMVERLMAAYRKYPHCIPCMRTNMIFLNEEGNFRTYRSWRLDDQTLLDIPSYQLLPVGVGGVLYPPHALPKEAFDKEVIEKTCPRADDLWLKFWTTHEGYKAVRPRDFCRYNDIPGTQETALHKTNVRRNENDEAIENIRAYFDECQDGFAGILERIEKDRFC